MDWGGILARLGQSRGDAPAARKGNRMSPTMSASLIAPLLLAYLPGLMLILGLLRGRRAISAAA